jgi:hypothetical protein
MQRKPSATSHRQQTIVIANIRFVPKLKSAKTLVKRHRKLHLNMLLAKSGIASAAKQSISRAFLSSSDKSRRDLLLRFLSSDKSRRDDTLLT